MTTPTSNGVVSDVLLFGSNNIDSLLSEQKWGGSVGTSASLTYSFGGSNSIYKNNYGTGEPLSGFAALTSTQQNAVVNALAAWSEIANIQFTQVTDSSTVAGDLRFAKSSLPSTAWAYIPGASPEAGDVWFSHSDNYDTDTKGTYGYITFLHEIGHALGLKHPHDTDGSGVVADSNIDSTAYTVMSYKSYVGQPVNAGLGQSFFPTTPMLNDIAAIQYLYGANMSTRSGDTVYSWAPGQQLLETIWDGGGIDTINWSNQSSAAKINLGAGQWSELGPTYWNGAENVSQTLAIAYNVTIENATGGAGNDTITGNDVSNVLNGGDGNDSLKGEAGNDTLVGNFGNDTLTGGSGADQFTFYSLTAGIDIITDFLGEQADKLVVSASGFGGGLIIGDLSSEQFTIGSAAADESDRFIYDSTTGGLFFDMDGIGTSGQVQLATLSTNLSLIASNISVIA
jgi:Ca2+-binding RTX toxin-like protein